MVETDLTVRSLVYHTFASIECLFVERECEHVHVNYVSVNVV